MKSFVLNWFSVFLWSSIIFYLSHQSYLAITSGIWDLILRKFGHIVEYAILIALFWRALSQHYSNFIFLAKVSFVFTFLYAISDEVHQRFIPGRWGSYIDVVVDSIGIVLFISWKYYQVKILRL